MLYVYKPFSLLSLLLLLLFLQGVAL